MICKECLELEDSIRDFEEVDNGKVIDFCNEATRFLSKMVDKIYMLLNQLRALASNELKVSTEQFMKIST
jgi:hypothetical protein